MSPDPPRPAALRRFVDAVAAGHCPYLAASRDEHALTFGTLRLADLVRDGTGDPAAALFAHGVLHVEALRARRLRLRRDGRPETAALLCHNLVVAGSATFAEPAARDLVDWPHHLLRSLYTDVGVMIGKFWTHEAATARDGRAVPRVPVTFLSVRSAIRGRDPDLLTRRPDVGRRLRHSQDAGRDVVRDRLGERASGLPALVAAYPVLRDRMQRGCA